MSTLTYTVNIDTRIEEYRGEKQLFDPKELENMKKDIETHLEKHTHELVKKMQELKVDPLQLGIQTKNHSQNQWKKKNGMNFSRRWTLRLIIVLILSL